MEEEIRKPGPKADYKEQCSFRTLSVSLRGVDADVSGVAEAATPKAMLKLASKILGTPAEDICILSRAVKTRNSNKRSVFNLVYSYSDAVNATLKTTLDASFCVRSRVWNVPQHLFDEPLFRALCDNHFSMIVDLEDAVVYATGKIAVEAPDVRYYGLLPVPVTVNMDDIHEAARDIRPQDDFTEKYDKIFDGKSFVYPDENAFSTRHPFLLVRLPVSDGQLRYMVYSTLTVEIEAVLYGDRGSVALARFHEACGAVAEPVLLPPGKVRKFGYKDFEKLGDDVREYMGSFLEEADGLSSEIPDMDVSLVPLEYAEMMTGEGLRSVLPVKAPVNPSRICHEIAYMTGQSGERIVTIHVGQEPPLSPESMRLLILHGLAEILVTEKPEFRRDNYGGHVAALILGALAMMSGKVSKESLESHLLRFFRPHVVSGIVEATDVAIDALKPKRCSDVQRMLTRILKETSLIKDISTPHNVS